MSKGIPPQKLGLQGQRSIAPNLLPGVQAKDLSPMACNNCGGTNFYPVHALMVASRFQSRNAMPTLVQFPSGFACSQCDKINPFDEASLDKTLQKEQDNQKAESEGGDLGVNVADDINTKESLK